MVDDWREWGQKEEMEVRFSSKTMKQEMVSKGAFDKGMAKELLFFNPALLHQHCLESILGQICSLNFQVKDQFGHCITFLVSQVYILAPKMCSVLLRGVCKLKGE